MLLDSNSVLGTHVRLYGLDIPREKLLFANSEDLDQTASDLGLHSLLIALLRVFRLYNGLIKSIMKTCLYNFDPLQSHFYIVKLGFTGGIHYFSHFCSKTWIVGIRWNRLAEAVLTNTHNLCFEQKLEKYQNFLSENFQFLEVKFSI